LARGRSRRRRSSIAVTVVTAKKEVEVTARKEVEITARKEVEITARK
jgi:hypothetical protein